MGLRFFCDRRGGFGIFVGDAFEIFVDSGAAFGVEHGLDVVALFAGELSDFGRADGDDRKIGVDGELLQILRGETFAHVGERGQAEVGLVDAVEADGFVVVHAREGRFDFVVRRL